MQPGGGAGRGEPMQGVTFGGDHSAYSHQNQGSGDQYSHLSDAERKIMEFLQTKQNEGDGVHVAAIGRAIKVDPAVVRSEFSIPSPLRVLADAFGRTAKRLTNWWRVETCSSPPTTTTLPSRQKHYLKLACNTAHSATLFDTVFRLFLFYLLETCLLQ